MKVIVLSPQDTLYDGEAKSVKVPGRNGQFEILSNHAPLVSSLDEGTVMINTGSGQEEFKILKGFVEVLRNEVSVLVQQ